MNDNEKLLHDTKRAIFLARHADQEQWAQASWDAGQVYADTDAELEAEARAALAVFEKAHTPTAPPVYLAADLWQALGAPISDFDAYYERNGWADTWANVLGAVRDHFRPKCGQDTEGERCVLTAGHLPPHYGASDVGSSEPVPVPEPQGEPSDAQVERALEAWDFNDGDSGKDRDYAMRAALRATGGVR